MLVALVHGGEDWFQSNNVPGPGRGPWQVASPRAHGLDPKLVEEAADLVFDSSEAALRDCFLVIKDGVLVFERYSYDAYNETPHAGNSMTKTLGALIVGWAQMQGLLDIDADITRAYGVPSPKPYPVTCRQIMSQAIAGPNGPGQSWAYDAVGLMWIDVLPRVVLAATGRWPSEIWAEELAKPLGLAPSFVWPLADQQWAAGSFGTCRDFGRVGQLLLNSGRWRGHRGPLVSEDYVKAMVTPQTRFPPYTKFANPCYGLLTWLNTNPGSDHGSRKYPGHCKLWPRRAWLPAGSPADVAIISGVLGQLVLVDPAHDLVIVSMGFTVDDFPVERVLFEAVCSMLPGSCQAENSSVFV